MREKRNKNGLGRKRTNVLSIRLDDEESYILNTLSSTSELSKSDVIRNLIHEKGEKKWSKNWEKVQKIEDMDTHKWHFDVI